MSRAIPNRQTRSVQLDTGQRTIDLPVDGAGHVRRAFTLDTSAVRAKDGKPDYIRGFTGHAALFDSPTWIGSKRYGFFEEMAPGAFTKTLQEADVRFLQNHDPNLIIARNTAGTLSLAEDDRGLATDADMDTRQSYVNDLAISLERGDTTQMSFAFDMIGYEWSIRDDGTEVLRHTEVALHDVSAVTYPAYTDTDAALRMDMLAVARSEGWDALDIEALAKRLADPDPEFVRMLRCVARGEGIEPVSATRSSSEQEPPPVDATAFNDLARATLALQHKMTRGA